MPSAEQFRAAAQSARAAAIAAEAAEQTIDACRRDTGLHGGRVMLTVIDALTTSQCQATMIAEDCRRLAQECETRATVCDEHVRVLRGHDWAVREWQQAHELSIDDPISHRSPGQRPIRPTPPAYWVEPR